jgi:hypothetical protein
MKSTVLLFVAVGLLAGSQLRLVAFIRWLLAVRCAMLMHG